MVTPTQVRTHTKGHCKVKINVESLLKLTPPDRDGGSVQIVLMAQIFSALLRLPCTTLRNRDTIFQLGWRSRQGGCLFFLTAASHKLHSCIQSHSETIFNVYVCVFFCAMHLRYLLHLPAVFIVLEKVNTMTESQQRMQSVIKKKYLNK